MKQCPYCGTVVQMYDPPKCPTCGKSYPSNQSEKTAKAKTKNDKDNFTTLWVVFWFFIVVGTLNMIVSFIIFPIYGWWTIVGTISGSYLLPVIVAICISRKKKSLKSKTSVPSSENILEKAKEKLDLQLITQNEYEKIVQEYQRPKSSDEALKELRRWKEKLDLQIITQEEYDKKKEYYKQFID
jgi:hypothetical protein